jgi:asparagine synthase (glutamine-hydrolysing)
MRSDASFGAFVSGGIDSSAVVASMAQHASGSVKTFSVGFNDPRLSELAYGRLVANEFGTDHHELVVDPESFMKDWPTAALHRGAPVSEASDIPILMLSRWASRSVKMVLTGEGADELLGGYPKHRAEPWVGLYQNWVSPPIHSRIVSPIVNGLPQSLRRLKILALAAGEPDPTNRMRLWFGGVSVAQREALLGRPCSADPPETFPYSLPSPSALRRTLFFDQTSWLPDNLLERGDRMMMGGSIEGRMPFLDVGLAGVVARFPDQFLTGAAGGKLVLRTSMAGRLPRVILERKKSASRCRSGLGLGGTFEASRVMRC